MRSKGRLGASIWSLACLFSLASVQSSFCPFCSSRVERSEAVENRTPSNAEQTSTSVVRSLLCKLSRERFLCRNALLAIDHRMT